MRLRPLFLRLPVINSIIMISALYASEGDPNSVVSGARWVDYIDRLLIRFLMAAAFAYLLVILVGCDVKKVDVDGYVISGYPSLIGFGIGVYALIFGMSKDFFDFLKKHGIKNPIAYVNGSMAFCLLVLIFCFVAAFVSKLFGTPSPLFSIFVFLYGAITLIDLVAIIFVAVLRKAKAGRVRYRRHPS